MRRATFLGRNVRRRHRTSGVVARMSSLVETGSPAQFPVPLTLLTTTKPLPNCESSNTPPPLLPRSYLRVTPPTTSPALYPLQVSAAVKDLHVKVPCYGIMAVQLQNSARQESSESPGPEKPKWEDEQYPDIGKTIDIVSNHLPFLLIQPLPKSILSPRIELRLFPSTYPSIPTLRLGKFLYRTFFRAVRWFAPVILNRSLRSFGSPSGIKGVGLEITCFRVIKIENGRRIEARWRTASSPWSIKPESSTSRNTAEEMPRTWTGWFYFDIDRKGLIIRHIIENVNSQRNMEGMEGENRLKDILVRTVSNGRGLGEGFGSVEIEKGRIERDMSKLRWTAIVPRIFPSPSPSNIMIYTRTYC